MILISGDTHGDIDYRKLDNYKIISQFGRLPDYMLVAGDFGVPWSNDENNAQDLYMKKWYENKPYDIIVILGNHENYSRVEKMPREIYHGAWVRRYTLNVVFVEKNQILEIEDKKFYCLGGADSTDKERRIIWQSWWPQEQATYADFIEMEKLLERVNEVDYVVTHTCPENVVNKIHRGDRINDVTSKLLTFLDSNIKYKHWYFGHMHQDVTILDKYTCLYNKLVEV